MRRLTTVALLVAMGFGLGSPAKAADDDIATRVTDPELLRSLGFKAGAENVYAFLDRLNQPIRVAQEPTDYFGGTASGFTTYTGQAFTAFERSAVHSNCDQAEDLYYVSGNPVVRVLLDIPNGARLQAIRWWAFDTVATQDLAFQVQSVCLPNQSAGPPVKTFMATQSTSGSGGFQSGEMVINLPVDTKTCTYSVWADLAPGGIAGCNSRLYKVRAQWVRQVSPAPGTARFIDVPINHPFFKFVEALAASGITGGCAANQYCPDSPVTRGQMAVFLATALGLNWGGL